jgi:hypothetical protein
MILASSKFSASKQLFFIKQTALFRQTNSSFFKQTALFRQTALFAAGEG